MTYEQLNEIGIRQWNVLKENYDHPDLLLGNGFSINQNAKFTYKSLFDTFLGNCPAAYQEVFKHFNTTNFELILEYLTHTQKVNEILKLPTAPVIEAIKILKNGLIESIKQVHPRVADIDWNSLDTITRSLKDFNDVFTTNYDLYLYHMIMRAKDFHTADKNFRPYNDYFWGQHNAPPGYREFVNYQDYKFYKHIYYVHGALFIFKYGVIDLKITRGAGVELIEVIAEEIQKGNFPIFVTEGNSQDKMNAIYRSNYLLFSLKALNRSTRPLLVYGHSLSDVDEHIISALYNSPRKLIYAIYVGDRTPESLQHEKHSILVKFPKARYAPEIEFVDSSTVFIP